MRTRAVAPWCGLAMVLVAAPVSARLAATSEGAGWASLVDDTMSGLPGGWRLMRGGFAFLEVPSLLVLLALMLVATWRRSRRDAVLLGAVALTANVVTQLVKHPVLGLGGLWSGLDPLSGHVGVVGGVCLGWLLVARPGRRSSGLGPAAAVAIGGVGAGVILAGWHTPFQVLCPLLVCTGVALAGSRWSERAAPHRPGAGPLAGLAVGASVLAAVVSAVVAGWWHGDAVTAVALTVGGAFAGAILSVSLLAAVLGSGRTRPAPATAPAVVPARDGLADPARS